MQKLNKLKKVVASNSARAALLFLILMAFMAIFAPFLGTQDPTQLDPSVRLQPPSAQFWLGTDALGRDLYSRVVYGAQVSFMVGFGVLAISVFFGVILGSLAGYFRRLDAVIMRVMDGVMAIPGILLAIALVSVSGASLTTVLIAIAIPEIPRMTRLVRGVILSVRSEPYVEAAMTVGTSAYVILSRHMFPNTFAPLIVQGTYVFASAVLLEAVLSFLGAGIPPEMASWGNIIAEGRLYFQLIPGIVLYPGIVLSITILSINVLGDALRDALDPKLVTRL
ncbi:ABC transporter permease [Providencia rettgeri]|uniref:ABC transporter permease n=1 Tax=Alcaligenes parafaecalis TaxID=171260 RepID=A0ABT3VI19_9BURK|nr:MULTISPECIES: ABC transporter permease [Alcaligenes]MBY6346245.1 ABC transporter permease [Providencia rettgeri]MCB4324053.1 ABC transporter permease [Alcaligenes sp. 13f]MCX5463134.1 ABC transporter permease [Alcaligenes parafaecalis]QTC00613.1 ABC transporter permease [Alcaligenes sp. SORT26]